MSGFISTHGGLGILGFGSAAFSETRDFEYAYMPRPVFSGSRRTTYGWGFRGQRVRLRPELYTPVDRDYSEIPSGTILLTVRTNDLIQTLRTDVRNPYIKDLEFTESEEGSADFTLTLLALPDFPILPFSILQVKLGDTDYDWYAGIINYPDTGGIGISPERRRDGPFQFTGTGLRQYLNSIEAQTVFTTGCDVTDVVREIAQTWILPYAMGVTYDDDKIWADAGVPLTEDIDLSKHPIANALEILGDLAGCRWGIDGERDFFFLPFEAEPSAVYFVGYDFHEWLPQDNMDSVVNYWLLTRNTADGSGESGWAVGGVYEDAGSQSKDGFKKDEKEFPGYWDEEVFDIVGENLLDSSKDPQPAATARNWTPDNVLGLRHIPIGRCYVVEPPKDYWATFDDLDDTSIWTGSVSKDFDTKMWAANSIKISHPGAGTTTVYLYKALEFFGKIKRIAFYFRSSVTGAIGEYGCGYAAWNTYTQPLSCSQAGRFDRLVFDITKVVAGGIDNIRYFGIGIDIAQACDIHLDRLEVEVYGARWLNLKVSKVKYNTKAREVEVEFGALPPSLPAFIRGLMAKSTELNYSQEIR